MFTFCRLLSEAADVAFQLRDVDALTFVQQKSASVDRALAERIGAMRQQLTSS